MTHSSSDMGYNADGKHPKRNLRDQRAVAAPLSSR